MATPDQEVIDAIKNKPDFTGEALTTARVLTDAAEALIEKIGKVEIHMPIKIFRGGAWELVNLPLNLAQGDVSEKAIAKALVGILSVPALVTAGAAVGGVATAAGAPFIIAFGASVAFGYYAGVAISELVSGTYDIVVGPDFEYDEKRKIISVDYTLEEAITAPPGIIHNESFKKIVLEKGLSDWTLVSDKGGQIELKNNTFEFLGESLSSLRKDGSIFDITVQEMHPFGDFNLKITNSSTYSVINLLKRTDNQIASLAKSDSSVMYALANLKSYAISGDSAASVDFTDAYIKDKAAMLYWHNVAKTSNLGVTTVDTQLRNPNLHYTDMGTGIEYGEGYFYVDYDKKITFGTDNGEQILGADDKDRLYGMGGNDKIVSFGGDDYIEAGQGSDTVYSGTGNDTLDGGSGEDTLHGGSDTDTLLGGNDTDFLYGDAGGDTLLGGDDNATDILVGGSGSDTLLGQGGDDIMIGGNSLTDLYSEKEYDYLSGGRGFDTYYVSNQDYIADIDYSGLIMFNDKSLSGKKTKIDDATYEDDNFIYALNGSNMVVVEKATQEYITIENFNFNSKGFGIDFSDKQDIELRVSDATTIEGGDITFDVGMNAGEGEIIDNDDIFMRVA